MQLNLGFRDFSSCLGTMWASPPIGYSVWDASSFIIFTFVLGSCPSWSLSGPERVLAIGVGNGAIVLAAAVGASNDVQFVSGHASREAAGDGRGHW